MRTAPARGSSRLALLLVAGGALAFGAVLLRAGLSDLPSQDRFQVLDVISDPTLSRHAVIYRHEPPGGGLPATGVWIVEGAAPEKGGRERPVGSPAAIWRDGFVRVGWQAGRLRLVGEPHRVLSDAARVDSCHEASGSGHDTSQLCIDPARVTFVPLPR